MVNYLVSLIVIFIIIYGLYRKVDIFDTFLDGVKEGINISFRLFPTIFAVVMAINILINSNLLLDIGSLFFKFGLLPKEVFPLALMKPISGSSSVAILNSILMRYGPDSYIGRIASVIGGSTDTTVYIISLYFGSIGIRKIKYSLVVG